MSVKRIGSCQCGKVNFEVEGEFESFFLCHCKYCQKDTGSAFAANLFSTKSTIKWLDGKELIKTFNIPNTRHVKSFCCNCGSALPNVQDEGKLLVVPAGSLEQPVDLRPNAHLFTDSKAVWEDNLDSLPEFTGLPS